MKRSLALAALVIGLSTSVFAADHAKGKAPKAKVSFTSLSTDDGFSVSIDNPSAQKSLVIIYDKDSNVIFKDVLSKNATTGEKGYVLTSLPNGDYAVEVGTKDNMVKKHIHVYEDSGVKSYFFVQ